MVDCYVADSKAKAVEEYAPYLMYFFNTLLLYDHLHQQNIQKGYYSTTSFKHLRHGTKGTLAEDATVFHEWTMDAVRDFVEQMPIGTPDECVEKIIHECDEAGAEHVLLVCNRGGMPAEMYMNQVRRIGNEVLPRLQKHKVTRVKFAEGVTA